MANMGYCRFRNTLRDLEDCYDALDVNEGTLSADERTARDRLVQLCGTIFHEFGDDD